MSFVDSGSFYNTSSPRPHWENQLIPFCQPDISCLTDSLSLCVIIIHLIISWFQALKEEQAGFALKQMCDC